MPGSGIYRLGPFGRGVHVDENGFLLVRVTSLPIPSSGITLPAVGASLFGQQFYVNGTGLFFRGISDWEQLSTS